MAKRLRLVVTGATGKMGAMVAELAAKDADARFEVVAALSRSGPDIEEALGGADVVVDFSAPEASVEYARAAAAARKAAVIGTTGLSNAQKSALAAAARRAPVFYAANFSAGVAVLARLAKEAVQRLPKWEKAIVETHHSQKKDAPSGTALRLAEAAGGGVPIASQRVGDVVGDHTLTLAGPFERLELTHRAHARSVFAKGALEAAAWTFGKKPGLYGMDDLLGLK